jgi:cob(I)alamin adenosyltransferase
MSLSLEDYKKNKKLEVWNLLLGDLFLDNLNECKDMLREIKKNWFKIGAQISYKKKILEMAIPSMENLYLAQEKEIKKIKNKYSSILEKDLAKIKKKLLSNDW